MNQQLDSSASIDTLVPSSFLISLGVYSLQKAIIGIKENMETQNY